MSVGMRIAGVLVSFVLAWTTFRFVESPIRFGKKNWIRPVSLMAASMIVAGFGYAATRDGFVSRFPKALDDLGRLRSVVWSTPECRAISGLGKIDYCRTTNTGGPDVLLIGDSHAAVLYDGLAPLYQRRSISLMNLGEAGCAPFYDTQTFSSGRSDKDCKTPVNAMINFAVHAQSVRTIIFSARGPRYMSGEVFGALDSGAAPKKIWWEALSRGTSQPEMYVESLHNTLSLLNARGKRVVLFIDWPELGFDPRSCIPRPHDFWRSARNACSVSRVEVDIRNRAYRDQVLKLEKEFPGMQIFDPVPFLCDFASCYAMREGHLLYSDDNHVSEAGAHYLAERYFENLH